MRQQNLDPNQPKRFYAGKSDVAKRKPRDAHGHFVSNAALIEQQELARRQKFGMLLGSGGQPQQQQSGMPTPQGANSAEEHIQNMFGLRKLRR